MKKQSLVLLQCFLAITLFIITPLTNADENEFKIITLQHRFASDLLPVISPMVGADGTATGINNQLILRAAPQRMRDIETIISTLDIERVNRKITVKSNNSRQSQQQAVDASGAVKVGKVTVSNNKNAAPNTGRIEAESNNSDINQNNRQFINVLDGERAFIKVGQIVPFSQEWVSITRRYVQIDTTTDWREITTGFAVRPRTIGSANSKQIELEITPRIAKLNSNGYVDFEELKTTVRVNFGDWVDIGGTMQSNDEVSRKILGLQTVSNQQKSSLSIRVD